MVSWRSIAHFSNWILVLFNLFLFLSFSGYTFILVFTAVIKVADRWGWVVEEVRPLAENDYACEDICVFQIFPADKKWSFQLSKMSVYQSLPSLHVWYYITGSCREEGTVENLQAASALVWHQSLICAGFRLAAAVSAMVRWFQVCRS